MPANGGATFMRRMIIFASVLALAAMLAGCGKKTEQASESTSADSLLAMNPTEQAPGDLTPQESYDQAPPDQPAEPVAREQVLPRGVGLPLAQPEHRPGGQGRGRLPALPLDRS